MSELSRLVDALLGALVEFDPGSWSGADCAVLAERLARASKACDTASCACGRSGVRMRQGARAARRLPRTRERIDSIRGADRAGRGAGGARRSGDERRLVRRRGVAGAGRCDRLCARARARAAGARSIEELGSGEGCGAQASARGDRTRTAARPPSRRAVRADMEDGTWQHRVPGRVTARSRRAVRRHARCRDRPVLARGTRRRPTSDAGVACGARVSRGWSAGRVPGKGPPPTS